MKEIFKEYGDTIVEIITMVMFIETIIKIAKMVLAI